MTTNQMEKRETLLRRLHSSPLYQRHNGNHRNLLYRLWLRTIKDQGK